MAALLENQNRRNPNPNSDPDREEIEYDSNSEGDATLFSEEDPSDEAFFVAGGDGEPKFDEEEETVTGIRIGAAVTITKSIKELRDLGVNLPLKPRKGYWNKDSQVVGASIAAAASIFRPAKHPLFLPLPLLFFLSFCVL
ncbi:hypothetical protein CRG98_020961 [Punica granatum]|uniref:Uncharacterized protein n=1 Tax=Punica granatum TaxID=22663 RepID=A0A2I0JQR5_PUNGR|nr:hypothetical protein CRG98_020961 [Punica granatum]